MTQESTKGEIKQFSPSPAKRGSGEGALGGPADPPPQCRVCDPPFPHAVCGGRAGMGGAPLPARSVPSPLDSPLRHRRLHRAGDVPATEGSLLALGSAHREAARGDEGGAGVRPAAQALDLGLDAQAPRGVGDERDGHAAQGIQHPLHRALDAHVPRHADHVHLHVAAQLVAEGADYLGVGPAFGTATKDGLPAPLGPAGVGAVARAIPVPV
ncbi:thiamine phosphate synthase, partial [Longimicrobium sp.]|uniref:thiamine phosphate synthase n=1 Tax=Longimicrobium sp. TaxID=2029185 RepID=UPI0039C9FBD2